MIDLAALREAFAELENLAVLAESGQKQVLRASRAGTDVVLKLIKPGQEAEAVQREIQAVANLNCDYVPQVLDSGKRKIGSEERLFIVEPYIAGESYRQQLQREPKPPLDFVVRLADVLLRACCDFEAQGIVHRDLKPENLLIGVEGKIWIIDFGIVRVLDATSITPTHRAFGKFTLGYGAPEQMRNLKPQIDARADLFSIGVILYESLCGFQPYYQGKHDQMDVVRHVTDQDLTPLVLPQAQGFVDFVMVLCARFASRRPQTARQALEWFLEATNATPAK
ncbi:MAG: serine/threonine protein kinase [Proteobacteria bacterium]|nr:MAG: serine/threonine protein kinase [Pseudomonadota bacterium]